MCVIVITESNQLRPSETMIEKAWAKNEDGGGIAWREKNKKGDSVVHWKKGLDYEELKDLILKVPAPSVAHFRIASQGGVRPSMTHPFPITLGVEMDLEGTTKNYVLFHNGNWNDWHAEARHAAIFANTHIPKGKSSDTRIIAWLSAIYGEGFMDFLPQQKGVAFGPDDMEVFVGPGWKKIDPVSMKVVGNNDKGIWCSNDYFINAYTNLNDHRMCLFGRCTRKDHLDTDQRCPEHPLAQRAPEVAATPAPFPQNSTPISTGPRISLERAERLHLAKKLSKNKLKDVRRLYLRISSNDQKDVMRALSELVSLTAEIDNSLRGQVVQ